MKDFVEKRLSESAEVLARIRDDPEIRDLIVEVADICARAITSGGKILLAGNGGSAADAQHLAGEFVGRFAFHRPGLPAIALTTDTSILTAVGNDYGFAQVFARQIQALGRRGDVFFAISTSGGSANIIRAVEASQVADVTIVGFTGRGGGELAPLCDHCFRVPHDSTPRIQEGHKVIGHLVCELVERSLFSTDQSAT